MPDVGLLEMRAGGSRGRERGTRGGREWWVV